MARVDETKVMFALLDMYDVRTTRDAAVKSVMNAIPDRTPAHGSGRNE